MCERTAIKDSVRKKSLRITDVKIMNFSHDQRAHRKRSIRVRAEAHEQPGFAGVKTMRKIRVAARGLRGIIGPGL